MGAQEGGRTSPRRTRRDIQCLLLAAVGTGLPETGTADGGCLGWRALQLDGRAGQGNASQGCTGGGKIKPNRLVPPTECF